MLTRHCMKITSSSSRSLLFSKFPIYDKRYILPNVGQCNSCRVRYFATPPLTNVDKSSKGLEASSVFGQAKNVNSPSQYSPVEILEKLVADLSTDIYQKNRVYKNDLMRTIAKVQESNFSTKKQGLLLLRCCTELLLDEAPAARMALAEEIWNTLKPHTKFTVEHYDELLRVYIANNRGIKVGEFIQQMAPLKPTITTYELILRALGEVGDLNQATEVIANMKSQNLPATKSIFHSLIICQGKVKKLENIQEVLTMMKSLKFDITIDTFVAIARGYAWNWANDDLLQVMEKAQLKGLEFEETHVMEVVKTMALVRNYQHIPQILRYLPKETLESPSISAFMQSVCSNLVFQNHPLPALEIYNCLPLPSFGPKDDKGLHGRSFVRDCVKASISSSMIGLVAQDLMASGRNPIALQNASEAALQLGKVPLAVDLFMRMKQMGLPLRPHYFWPILINTSKAYGEKGIMKTLTKMVQLDVKPDYETMIQYTMPNVSFTSPQNLMKKFQDTGLSVSDVLTPMVETLLNMGQVRAASELCELFEGRVDVEKILNPLVKGYQMSLDIKSTVHLIEDVTKQAADKSKDWLGRILCVFFKNKRMQSDLTDILKIIKELKKTPIKMSPAATDFCLSQLPSTFSEEELREFREAICSITDEKVCDEGELFSHQMPHPRHMNEESLKAHLCELEAKGMNTRGVLRRLLQQYCKEGNLTAAREVAQKCEKEGIFLSAGMKAAIFDMHVKLGQLELAEMSLADLCKTSPNFTLDEHKIIDLATLMVLRKKTKQAFDLLHEQSKKRRIIGGRGISMNCFRLLDMMATHGSPQETLRLFELLTSLRYCQASNSLLGPLVRVHIKKDDIKGAVAQFAQIAKKYGKTPLKHELLCIILTKMNDGQTEENFINNEMSTGWLNNLAKEVLKIDKETHGSNNVQLSLIAALAEVGYKKTLRKLFLDPAVAFHPDGLMRRCDRFANEKKIAALETIAECAKDLRRFDVNEVYEMILRVYQRDDKYDAALKLWERMQDADIRPSDKFVRNLYSMLKANNRPINPQLAALVEQPAQVSSR